MTVLVSNTNAKQTSTGSTHAEVCIPKGGHTSQLQQHRLRPRVATLRVWKAPHFPVWSSSVPQADLLCSSIGNATNMLLCSHNKQFCQVDAVPQGIMRNSKGSHTLSPAHCVYVQPVERYNSPAKSKACRARAHPLRADSAVQKGAICCGCPVPGAGCCSYRCCSYRCCRTLLLPLHAVAVAGAQAN